jgi:hypothetical protein
MGALLDLGPIGRFGAGAGIVMGSRDELRKRAKKPAGER